MARASTKKTKAGKRRLASWVLADLYRLASVIRADCHELDPEAWLKVGANILSSAPAGKEELTRAAPARWGLDHSSLLRFATRCKLDCTAEDIARHVNETTRWRKAESERIGRPHHVPMKPDTIGALLCVTEDDRRAAKAWRIGTIGGSPEARIEAARVRDRQRKQRDRRQCGMMTRDEYLANSAGKPWEAAGMSRAKWYRSRLESATKCRETGLSETGLSENNKERETSLSGHNIINPDTGASVCDLAPCLDPSKLATPRLTVAPPSMAFRRRGFEPVEPYTRAHIVPGGLAARALEMALRNPPTRSPYRAGRAQRRPAHGIGAGAE